MCIDFQWGNPSVIMVVFNVTNEMSFKSCEKWLRRARNHNPNMTCPGKLSAVLNMHACVGVSKCELIN